MQVAANRVDDLRAELGFTRVDSHISVGEISGVPSSLTHVSSDPLVVMVRLRLCPDAGEPEVIRQIFEDIPPEAVQLAFVENCAAVSFCDIDDLPNDAIRVLLEKLADAIAANDLTAPPGCLRCGTVEDARLMYLEDRPTRLCSVCLEGAKLEKQQLEEDLNRATLGGFFGLPAVFTSVVAGWAILWTAADLLLDFFQIRAVLINNVTVILMITAVIAAGALLGKPLGNALRRSGIIRPLPGLFSLLIAVAAVACGELVYVTILIFRVAGIIDINAALQVFQLVLQTYTPFWIVVKGGLSLTLVGACVSRARHKETTRMDV